MSLWELVIFSADIVSGFMAITVAVLLYAKYRHPAMSRYAALMASLLAYTAGSLFVLLFKTGAASGGLQLTFLVVYWCGIFVVAAVCYTFGIFFCALLDIKPRPVVRVVLGLPALVACIVSGYNLAVGVGGIRRTMDVVMPLGLLWLCGEILVFCVLTVFLRARVTSGPVRQGLTAAALLLAVFIPAWVLENAGTLHTNSFLFFFLLWNIVSIAIAARGFFTPESASGPLIVEGMLERFASRYMLTPREREIASHLAQGSAYSDISGKLFISGKTVRNHITNLYMKTGAKNRLALIHLIRGA